MAVKKEEIELAIKAKIPDAIIELVDFMGDSDHYRLIISSHKFNGLKLLDQHRMVKDAIKEMMKEHLHAITIETVAL